MKKTSLFAMLLSLVGASAVSAATVTFTLDMSPAGRGGGPGSFQVRARSSSGDNFGIAGYSVDLMADPGVTITSLNHNSLRNSAATDGTLEGTVGFTTLRSADVAAGASLAAAQVNGSQDTVGPTPFLIRGLGQTAGDLASRNITTAGIKEGDPWAADLVLAQGTFSFPNVGNAEPLGFLAASPLTLANVFSAAQGVGTEAATIVTEVIPIPEPATLALAGLSLLGLVACSRRK